MNVFVVADRDGRVATAGDGPLAVFRDKLDADLFARRSEAFNGLPVRVFPGIMSPEEIYLGKCE